MYKIVINGCPIEVEASSGHEAIEIACRSLGYLSRAHYREAMGARARIEVE